MPNIKEAFTVKEHKATDEYHIFKGDFEVDPCNSVNNSICGAMAKSDSKKNIAICLDEVEARKLLAKYGRKVCANCIGYLYKTI